MQFSSFFDDFTFFEGRGCLMNVFHDIKHHKRALNDKQTQPRSKKAKITKIRSHGRDQNDFKPFEIASKTLILMKKRAFTA